MSRILIVSSDVVGDRMAGPGIRAWEFARALVPDHQVILAAPPPVPDSAPFEIIESRPSVVDPVIASVDVALMQGYALHQLPGLARARHLVVDLYDPFVLENLEVHSGQSLVAREMIHEQDLTILRKQLLQGDFFICASERQRHFWIGMLTIANRINPASYGVDRSARRLIDVVPFGLSAEPVRKTGSGLRDGRAIQERDVVVLWGGGIWNWFDPLTLLRGMHRAVKERPELKLVFMGTRHPNPSIPQMDMLNRAHRLSDELELTGRHVFFRSGWVPYAERQNLLADADIGVSLHFEHIETVYAFRTRVLDYLWAGLPMVLTRGDDMAELAASQELGLVVDYEDTEAVARALTTLAADQARRQEMRTRVLETARRFRWDAVIEPLRAYCLAPWQAPDRAVRQRDLNRIGRQATPLMLLMRKAWFALRTEGPRSVVRRTYRYARKHL